MAKLVSKRDLGLSPARIVARRGILELQGEDGETLRSVIYEPSLPTNADRACKNLLQEALAMGYDVSDVELSTSWVC